MTFVLTFRLALSLQNWNKTILKILPHTSFIFSWKPRNDRETIITFPLFLWSRHAIDYAFVHSSKKYENLKEFDADFCRPPSQFLPFG